MILCMYLGGGRWGYTNACIYMVPVSQALLQKHLMDIKKTWYGKILLTRKVFGISAISAQG